MGMSYEEVFFHVLGFAIELKEKREAQRKRSMRMWDQELWILKHRDGRYRRARAEQESIQHVWPPRGIGIPQRFPAEMSLHTMLPSLNLGPRPATATQQLAWSAEAMEAQSPQSAREYYGNERRRALEGLYLPQATTA